MTVLLSAIILSLSYQWSQSAVERLIDPLEDDDDNQAVFTNMALGVSADSLVSLLPELCTTVFPGPCTCFRCYR